MDMRLPSSILLGCAALLLFATVAEAQVLRPGPSIYIGARGGYTVYAGDLDGTPDRNINAGFGDVQTEQLGDGGFGVGGEIGYQATPNLAVALAFLYGNYPCLGEENCGNDFTGAGPRPLNGPAVNQNGTVWQVQLLLRYMLFSRSGISPFVEVGGAYVNGPAPIAGQAIPNNPNGEEDTGLGPVMGLGLDFMIGRQLSFFLMGQSTFVFPDGAVDNVDGSAALGRPLRIRGQDKMDFDILGFLGGGLRFFFTPGGIPVEATIDCPAALETGESGAFTGFVNDDATGPISYMWDFGDGSTANTLSGRHAYSAPGTYTVTFMAEGPVNTDTQTCTVTVTDPPAVPVTISSCRATPSRAGVGETVTFSANVAGDMPIEAEFDFGDGNERTVQASGGRVSATHSYDTPGTYTVTIDAENEGGDDACTITVTVGDDFCANITELNTVFFGYESATLNAEARGRLDENLEVLRRCPDICVVINGYADDSETNKLRLSERRADAVRQYYIDNGIDSSRLMARGLGEYPGSNSKDDPGPGDRNARRADSIPVDCDDMMNMN